MSAATSTVTPVSAPARFTTTDSPFKKELQQTIDGYFETHSRHATTALWIKAAVWLGSTFAALAVLVLVPMPAWLGVILSLSAGFGIAQVGFNVGHDAIHGSLSSKSWVNALFARSFDVMGASSRMWNWAHNVVHHTYTNVPGTDHDLEPGFYLHFYRHQRRGYLHRFQHIYAWVLYTLTMVVWVFKKDFVQLVERGPATTRRDVIDVIAGKVLHFALWLGVPMLFSPWAWWQVLIGYALMLAVTGFSAAVVFQMAHVVEGPAFPTPHDGRFDDDFVTHQLKTTANFAPGSAVATFFTGGLNHQVEHHLFPRICHIHYPAIAPLVEAVAKKHGVPYHANPTFLGAVASHVRLLKALGRGEQESGAPGAGLKGGQLAPQPVTG
ncbi:MAG: acyl-CoA desaturase [Myxococcaceae bacterium]